MENLDELIVEIECKGKMKLKDAVALNLQFVRTAENGKFIQRPVKQNDDKR